MIPAKDLMIGDLVKYNNKIYVVEEIDGKSNTIYVKSDTNEIYNAKNLIVCDDLEPILITGDILKNNGWSDSVNYRLQISDNQFLIYVLGVTSVYLKESTSLTLLRNIKYVHQLQQLLRVLNVDEKFINIKI